MKHKPPSDEAMVRHAFGLLLEIRSKPEARSLLGEAIGFLKMLTQERHVQATPVVISVHAMRIHSG